MHHIFHFKGSFEQNETWREGQPVMLEILVRPCVHAGSTVLVEFVNVGEITDSSMDFVRIFLNLVMCFSEFFLPSVFKSWDFKQIPNLYCTSISSVKWR